MSPFTRLLIVSNRLPVTVQRKAGRIEMIPSSGGLAAGLRGYHRPGRSLWIGWPGQAGRTRRQPLNDTAALDARFSADLAARALVPIHLSPAEVAGYYEGFSNAVVWPLFHYLLDRIPLTSHDWQHYSAVNRRYADLVASHYRKGDVIWVHDYHLMLVPALLRERLPTARIGFFLHTPFPAVEIFRILPWAPDLLHGLLGADLVGLHTRSYVRHFLEAAEEMCGLTDEGGWLRSGPRRIQVGAFPMGADVVRFRELAGDAGVRAEAARLRAEAGGRRVLLGVDRLDYTKGIPRRLAAYERLLEGNPALRDRVRLIQVAVPSRNRIGTYRQLRRRVEQLVGRINGSVGSIASAPIHYLFRSLPAGQLAALYLAADVMLVTPVRDGMNLVAKEFVASRHDEAGVLVLSRFAGAAEEMIEAVHVNPYDVDGMAATIGRVLSLSRGEERQRMRALRRRVLQHGVLEWADAFVAALTARSTDHGRLTPDSIPGFDGHTAFA